MAMFSMVESRIVLDNDDEGGSYGFLPRPALSESGKSSYRVHSELEEEAYPPNVAFF